MKDELTLVAALLFIRQIDEFYINAKECANLCTCAIGNNLFYDV